METGRMEMKKILVHIDWCDKNYGAVTDCKELMGVVAVTDKTMLGLKSSLLESIDFHIDGLVNDGEHIPEWLATKNFEIVYDYTLSAILQESQQFTTLAAISRATGIKHAQLSHYANAVCRPRPAQRKKVIDGLHSIGQKCLSLG